VLATAAATVVDWVDAGVAANAIAIAAVNEKIFVIPASLLSAGGLACSHAARQRLPTGS